MTTKGGTCEVGLLEHHYPYCKACGVPLLAAVHDLYLLVCHPQSFLISNNII